MLDRVLKLPLNEEEKRKEMAVIKTIAKNNGYVFHDIKKVYKNRKERIIIA
jgi:hypothetical protein